MKDIYISCAPNDESTAVSIKTFLESNGLECCTSPEETKEDDVRHSRIMILLVGDTINSSDDLINDVSTAVENGMTIIPFKLSDIMPEGKIGFYIKPLHWLDACNGNMDTAMSMLLDLCNTSLNRVGTDSDDSEGNKSSKKKKKIRKIFAITGISLLLIFVAIIVLALTTKSKPVKEMTTLEFFANYSLNYFDAYGADDYQAYNMDSDGQYAIYKNLEDDWIGLAVAIKFLDEQGNVIMDDESTFSQFGLTNYGSVVVASEDDWTPFLETGIRTLFPDEGSGEIESIVEELKTGSGNMVTDEYVIRLITDDNNQVFLLEAELN